MRASGSARRAIISWRTSPEPRVASARVAASRQRWTDRQGTFRLLLGNYETNDELSLDYRLGAGLGLGKYFIDRRGIRLMGSSGLQVLTERSSEGEGQESIALFLATSYSMWRFDTPELDLDFSLQLYPSLTESGRLRSDSDITLSWEIVKDLFWEVSAYGTYDNEADGEHQYDYGVTTGLGWKY